MKELIKELHDIDFTLAMFEDWMHGQDGDDCTEARKKLLKVIKKLEEIDNLG